MRAIAASGGSQMNKKQSILSHFRKSVFFMTIAQFHQEVQPRTVWYCMLFYVFSLTKGYLEF